MGEFWRIDKKPPSALWLSIIIPRYTMWTQTPIPGCQQAPENVGRFCSFQAWQNLVLWALS
jgi:hypothetical protein